MNTLRLFIHDLDKDSSSLPSALAATTNGNNAAIAFNSKVSSANGACLVDWVLIHGDDSIQQGASTFAELALFENVQLEVYLSAQWCSVFCINELSEISKIKGKKLTDELILGLLEQNLVDDIEEVKPILLHADDDIYVAVFNRNAYDDLIYQLTALDKPIRFIQSFAYSTALKESLVSKGNYIAAIHGANTNDEQNDISLQASVGADASYDRINVVSWVWYKDGLQSFVRTSKYQYFLLDNDAPIPYALLRLFDEMPPQELIIYHVNADYSTTYVNAGADASTGLNTDTNHSLKELSRILQTKYGIKCVMATTKQLIFGVETWNLYKEKSTKFTVRLNSANKQLAKILLRRTSYLLAIMALIWSFNIVSCAISNYMLSLKLTKLLAPIVVTEDYKQLNLFNLEQKIALDKHKRGIVDKSDLIALLNSFLRIIASVGTNNITAISYDKSALKVFLNKEFNHQQFSSYKSIFATENIDINLINYRDYLLENPHDNANNDSTSNDGNSNMTNTNNLSTDDLPLTISSDTMWVVTLHY